MDAVIAANRFGLGARPGELDAAASDPRGWLKAQIRRSGADQPEADPPLPDMRVSYGLFAQARGQFQAVKGEQDAQLARRMAFRPVIESYQAEVLARARLACLTPASFRERWTLFWSNHFTVSAKNVAIQVMVGPFEREAIRPMVFGRFEDMLVGVMKHPSMLVYLDQIRSAGPGSLAGQRRNMGLNENLAREALELHTVGANAGYSQADVTEFARALTGWSMGGERDPRDAGSYIYRAVMHEPGARKVMGRTYPDGGEDQARLILADLATHPMTARHIARKLAIHFVADDPPPALTARLDAAYRKSGGDLSALAQALIDSPEAWEPTARKLKTPSEFVVSAYRACGFAPTQGPREVVQPLTLMGQPPFRPTQPDGWSDQASDWAAPDAIVKRLSYAQGFAARFAIADPVALADAALGPRLSPASRTAIARAESRDEAMALLLMSPEFQRR
jgi:uncharacterized protein (DUF1800 family)